jgi:hypothetical protein
MEGQEPAERVAKEAEVLAVERVDRGKSLGQFPGKER